MGISSNRNQHGALGQPLRRLMAGVSLAAASDAGGIAELAVAAQVNPHLRDVMPSVLSRELGITGLGNVWLPIVVAVVLSVWTSLIAGLLPAITNAATASDGVGNSLQRTAPVLPASPSSVDAWPENIGREATPLEDACAPIVLP